MPPPDTGGPPLSEVAVGKTRFPLRILGLGSVRVRLIWMLVGVFGCALAGMAYLSYWIFARTQHANFDTDLYNHAVDVAQATGLDFFGDVTVQPFTELEMTRKTAYPLFRSFMQIRDHDGKVLARSGNLLSTTLPLAPAELLDLRRKGLTFSTIKAERLPNAGGVRPSSYRLVSYLMQKPGLPLLIIQIAAPLTTLEQSEAQLARLYVITVPFTLILAALSGLFLTRRALAPVAAMVKEVKAGPESKIGFRIEVPQGDHELEELAELFNSLLNRVDQFVATHDRFVADASHQLKTPLALLSTELEQMAAARRGAEDTVLAQNIKSMAGELRELSRLVDNLLILSKVDVGAQSIELSPVRVDEVAASLVGRLQRLAATKGVAVEFQLHPRPGQTEEIDFETMGDSGLIAILIQNLLENAVKYTPEGGRVRLDLSDYDDRIEIRVADTGPGVAPENRERIFDRFFREPTTANRAGGSGLGLSIARRIAHLHGGEIALEGGGVAGGGATFIAVIRRVAV